jgi:hypothetical protein
MRHRSKRMKLNCGNALTSSRLFPVFILLAAVSLVCVLGTDAIPPARRALPSPMGDDYLMLVNTAIAGQVDATKMAQFERSPYDGFAVSSADAYDTSPTLSLSPMKAQMARWKKSAAKQIWPWVCLNRMIGANDVEGNPDSEKSYFQRFQGLDLDAKAGAQNDFLENWRNALRFAKQTRLRISFLRWSFCSALTDTTGFTVRPMAAILRSRPGALPASIVRSRKRKRGLPAPFSEVDFQLRTQQRFQSHLS